MTESRPRPTIDLEIPDEFWNKMPEKERERTLSRGKLWPRQVRRLIEMINKREMSQDNQSSR